MGESVEEELKLSIELMRKLRSMIPADDIETDKFLSLSEIRIDERVPVASISGRLNPVIFINPEIIKKCEDKPEWLLFIIYHELFHLIIGPDDVMKSLADYIAVEAVINAEVTKRLGEEKYWSFLKDMYKSDEFPFLLLRPPEGYPREEALNNIKAEDMRHLIQKLYFSKEGISHHEIADFLRNEMNEAGASESLEMLEKEWQNLRERVKKEGFSPSPRVVKMVEEVLKEKEKDEDELLKKRSQSEDGRMREMEIPLTMPEKEATALIRKVINIMVERDRFQVLPRISSTSVDSLSIIPDFRKRSIFIKESLGFPVVYYEASVLKAGVTEHGRAKIYIDVSASMSEYYRAIYSALLPLVRRGMVKTYVWSTSITEISIKDFVKVKILSTGGTHISCVLEHILNTRTLKAVILTDGIVEDVSEIIIERVRRENIIYTILTPDGEEKTVKKFSKRVFRLNRLQ